jgi:hypothetical protein
VAAIDEPRRLEPLVHDDEGSGAIWE